MAEERFYTILTNVGKAKVANAALLNSNVSLTTLKVGDGNGAYYNPTEEQTELKNTVYTCNVGSVSVDKDNPNWIVAETIIPGSVGGFTIREVGLFDVEGDLIAIGKYPETYKPIVQSGASKDLNVRTIFEVSNAASVNLSINPSIIIATKEDIENLQKQVTKNTTDLNQMANNKADLTSPNFTGTPTIKTKRIATTEYIDIAQANILNGFTIDTTQENSFLKIGNINKIKLVLTSSTDVSSFTDVIAITSDCLPLKSYVAMNIPDDNGNIVKILASNSGKVQVKGMKANVKFYAELTWIGAI